jgi:hypothetical protein
VYHAAVARIDVLPSKTVYGRGATRFQPWVEVGILAHLRLEDWAFQEDAWFHRAAPVEGEVVRVERAVPFSPELRCCTAGEPPPEQRQGDFQLQVGEAERVAVTLLSALRPTLSRHAALGMVSRPGESPEVFRRRVLRAVGPAVREGRVRGEDAAAGLARLAAGVETRQLAGEHLTATRLLVGVVWYPSGGGPRLASDELLVTGRVVSCR